MTSPRAIIAATLIVVATVAVVVSQVIPSAQETDPLLGTWKLNLAKSKYEPGPGPTAAMRTTVDRGGGVFLTPQAGTDPQGHAAFLQVAFKFDGEDYPMVIKDSPVINTISLKRADRYSFYFTLKADGNAVATVGAAIAKDGKSYTEQAKGTNPQGKPVNNIQVWEKQ